MIAAGRPAAAHPAVKSVWPRAQALNLLAFQIGWWTVVLSAAAGMPSLGMAVVGALLILHLRRVRPYPGEALLIILTALIGLALESLLQASGWVTYAGDGPTAWLAPLWMVALWANFAMTLNVSLPPLRNRPGLAAVLGAVGGPAAYWGGAELGAMTFVEPVSSLAILALAWALLTPLLLALARRLSA